MSGLVRLGRGLHRWSARHPDADPAPSPGSPADWGPDVASVAYEAPDALLLVDPLVPGEREDLRAELDDLVRRHGRRVAIVTTLQFHRRSRAELAERYGASTSRAREALPAGVETVRIRGAGETMVWLGEQVGAIVRHERIDEQQPVRRLVGDGADIRPPVRRAPRRGLRVGVGMAGGPAEEPGPQLVEGAHSPSTAARRCGGAFSQ